MLKRKFITNKWHMQRGVVLIVALIMLLVMTLVGVTLISGSTLQERLAGNTRQLGVARANAEGALREAEQVLAAIINNATLTRELISTTFQNRAGYYIELRDPGFIADFKPLSGVLPAGVDGLHQTEAWTSATSVEANAVVNTAGQAITSPRYAIEYIGTLDHGINDSTALNIGVEKVGQVVNKPFAFRITAIGYGENDKISSILQSIYTSD